MSGSRDDTFRLWDLTTGAKTARLEIDTTVHCVVTLSATRLVAGDALGRLHWLAVVDLARSFLSKIDCEGRRTTEMGLGRVKTKSD